MPLAIRGLQTRSSTMAACVLCFVVATCSLRAAPIAPQPRSPAKYRDHLKSLEGLIAGCSQHTDTAHCSADAVGPDDSVTVPNQNTPRRISYDWLRALLELTGNRTISRGDAAPLLVAATERLPR
jgi:hypothetical protein